jgi:putative ABC transport system substrate-binding protein
VKRREFISLLGGATAAWPLAVRVQQRVPVIGFLRSTPSDPFTKLVEALRRGPRAGRRMPA